MDKDNQIAIEVLDIAIQHLQKQKETILAKISLFSKLVEGMWIIHKSTNTYYQVGKIDANEKTVVLHRPDSKLDATELSIGKNFRLAEQWEIQQHIQFLHSKFLRAEEKAKETVQLPEFYMISIKGEHGSKVRHDTLEKSVKEATRLSEKLNERVHILGVIAIVEPTIVQEPKTEYKLIKL